jgi:methionyl-tRNA formyltransferase
MPSLERIVFFGTPQLAVPTLHALCDAGRPPELVVTQPARPVGRGRQVHQPPVAQWALEQGLALDQPPRVRAPEFLDRMRALDPDVAVVVAFGQIFPRELLGIPSAGCINLHASLLPRHRGAAPIQAAIAAGDAMTGVTTMVMEEGLDTGPILLTEQTGIGAQETSGELAVRLGDLGGRLMVRTLEALEAGTVEPRAQEEELATYARQLRREDGRIDWARPAVDIERRLRAFTPWPGSFAGLSGESVKVLAARLPGEPPEGGEEPGTLLGTSEGDLLVRCGGGSALALQRLQRPGRKAVTGADLANGMRLEPGARFD